VGYVRVLFGPLRDRLRKITKDLRIAEVIRPEFEGGTPRLQFQSFA
jgi:hypothetical protein